MGGKLLRLTGLESVVGSHLHPVHDRLAAWAEPHRQRYVASRLKYRPQISLIVCLDARNSAFLPGTVASIQRQTYGCWELVIASDSEIPDATLRHVASLARRDPRIRLQRSDDAAIVLRLNQALANSRADFIGLLNAGDELAPDALYRCVRLLTEDPAAEWLYTDEDQLLPTGGRVLPFLKPTWSPEHFLSCMYTGGLSLYRRTALQEKGAFRDGFGAAFEYDLALRLLDDPRVIHHLPQVLFHRRVEEAAPGPPPAIERIPADDARRAVTDYLARNRIEAVCEPGGARTTHRVRFQINGAPRVSIIVPTAGFSRLVRKHTRVLVLNCIESILRRTTYANYEIVCVTNRQLGEATSAALRSAAGSRLRQVSFSGPFNFSEMINLGASAATGEHLLFLNDDIEVLSPDWLESMLEFCQQPEVGAVGSKLYFPSLAIQHAGVVTPPGGFPAHIYRGITQSQQPEYQDLHIVRNYSAVTGACMMTSSTVFSAAGGFDPAFPVNYNDIDYCFRVRELGYRVVYTPYAELIHYESVSRAKDNDTGAKPEELQLFGNRWGSAMAADPFNDAWRSSLARGNVPYVVVEPAATSSSPQEQGVV
jgi:O-antigen biosynthesis protein